jgi:hypothetical protein
VWYYWSNGTIASLEELEYHPELILAPINPIWVDHHDIFCNPYSNIIADLYTTTSDNMLYDDYLYPEPFSSHNFQIPPGAAITFPGNYSTKDPIGYESRFYSKGTNLKVVIPAGFDGMLNYPLVLEEIQGDCEVTIARQIFTDMATLREFIDQPHWFPYDSVRLLTRGETTVIYFVNPLLIANVTTFTLFGGLAGYLRDSPPNEVT